MSEEVRIAAIAVKNTINLSMFAEGIGIKTFENWKNYLEMDEMMLSGLLKYPVDEAKVLLYKMGAVILVGFNEDEERMMMSALEGFLQIKYLHKMYLFNEYDTCSRGEIYTKAEAMARSVRLNWIEIQVDDLMEQAESILAKLAKGGKKGFTPKLCRFLAKIQRFEIESIGIIAMLGRPYQGKDKTSYSKYVEIYEIKERLTVLHKKLEVLKGITNAHELFGRFLSWQRLLIAEVILLVCFPIPGLLSLNLIRLWTKGWDLIQILFYSFFK